MRPSRRVSTPSLLAAVALLLPSIVRPVLAASPALPPLELVETAPVESPLDHPDLRETGTVWIEMIDGADATIDLAHFYAVSEPGSRLEEVIVALERAAARGVTVRALFDKGFYDRTYKDVIDRLGKAKGITTRLLDAKTLMKGVHHAKYLVVDRGRPDADALLGSANFDWRSLAQIQELGIRFRAPELVAPLVDVFDTDWGLAGGAAAATRVKTATPRFPVTLADGSKVSFAASPKGFLPDESLWDLPALVALLDGAKSSIRLQLLSFATVGYDGDFFPDLDVALRRAAARGVKVEITLSHWQTAKKSVWAAKSLAAVPGITMRILTVPQLASGFVPFARVAHAKFLVVDGARAWVGTSNWSGDYFHSSRNVGLLIDGGPIPATLERFFATGAAAAEPVDLCRDYPPPRVGE